MHHTHDALSCKAFIALTAHRMRNDKPRFDLKIWCLSLSGWVQRGHA